MCFFFLILLLSGAILNFLLCRFLDQKKAYLVISSFVQISANWPGDKLITCQVTQGLICSCKSQAVFSSLTGSFLTLTYDGKVRTLSKLQSPAQFGPFSGWPDCNPLAWLFLVSFLLAVPGRDICCRTPGSATYRDITFQKHVRDCTR